MKISIIEKEFHKSKFTCPFCGYIMATLFALTFILHAISRTWPSELLDTIGITMGLVFMAMLAFFFVISIGDKAKIIPVGSVLLQADGMEIVHKEEIMLVPYPEVRNISLRYRGFKGVILFDIRPSLIPEDGLGNILTFTYNGKSYSYEIFLENKRQKDALFKIMKRLRGRIGRF